GAARTRAGRTRSLHDALPIYDVVAEKFDISLNAMTWAGRVGLLIVPPIAYWVTYRVCLGLQQHDREVLAHGVETGIIKRLPDGRDRQSTRLNSSDEQISYAVC